MRPRDVKCPTCGADIRFGCVSVVNRRRAQTHAERWHAIGVETPPTYRQQAEDAEDGRNTDLCRRLYGKDSP